MALGCSHLHGHKSEKSVLLPSHHRDQSKTLKKAFAGQSVSRLVVLCFCVSWMASLSLMWHAFQYHIRSPHHAQTSVEVASASLNSTRRIPPIVHYVYGLADDADFGGRPFQFHSMAAMASAMEHLRPDKIMFWHRQLPSGFFWNETLALARERGVQMDFRRARDVTEIFGRRVGGYAHKSDVIRLEALRDFGGIYLDADAFVCQRAFILVRGREAAERHVSLRPAVQQLGGDGGGSAQGLERPACWSGQRHYPGRASGALHPQVDRPLPRLRRLALGMAFSRSVAQLPKPLRR
jgi:hypothetical protein